MKNNKSRKLNKVLVTGARGFVGSSLVRHLSKSGIRVIAVVRERDDLDLSCFTNLENIVLIKCDLSNIKKLPKIILDRNIDAFFHFAWEGTSGNIRADSDVQTDNIRYTCDAVKACCELECDEFVFASSIMEYEVIDVMKKGVKPNAGEIYSTAKLAADYMAKITAINLGIVYKAGMISNIYGPGEKSFRLINSSLRKMLKGEHCSFSSGEQKYDFIYIDDAVRAFQIIAERGYSGKSYYIGSLHQQPLKCFLMKMRDLIDPKMKIGLGEMESRATSLTYEEFDVNGLYNDTGFEPLISFEDGIQRTINWLKESIDESI